MNPLMVVLAAGKLEQTRLKAGELVQTARRIGMLAGDGHPETGIHIVLAGEAPPGLAGEIADAFGEVVTAMNLPKAASWDLLRTGLEDLTEKIRPAMVLFAHTTMAREVGPALAVAVGGVSVSNVSAVKKEGNAFIFTRPVMDNTRTQDVRVPDQSLCILSLAPGAGVGEGRSDGGVSKGSGPGGRVDEFHPPAPRGPSLKRVSLSSRSGAGDGKLSQASIIAAAGRGIGEQENLERVKAFAARLPGAATAASRPLVDQGWVDYDRQVGITGAVVSPDLYVALGISGSSQHLAGMAGSKWVVSVNISPDAPICRHSDLCVQADVRAFIDAFLESRDKN